MNGGYASKQQEHDFGLTGAAALLLGILVAVVGFFAFMMWADARNARDDARQAATSAGTSGMAGMAASVNAGSLTSYAGAAPATADALATAHTPYPAVLPPRLRGLSPTSISC